MVPTTPKPRRVNTFRRNTARSTVLILLASALVMLLASCGGGSGEPPTQVSTGPTPTIRTGKLPLIVFLHGFRGTEMPPNPLEVAQCALMSKDDARAYVHAHPLPTVDGSRYSDIDKDWTDPQLGYEVRYAHYTSHPCYTATYKEAADEIASQIDALLSETGREQVILIAHSTGGIVAREYIERNPNNKKVAAFISLGAPYNGIVINDAWIGIAFAQGIIPTRNWIINQNVADNFTYRPPGDPSKAFYAADKRNPNVRYYLVGGNLTEDRSARAQLLHFLSDFQSTDDGLIPTFSALYMQGANNYLPSPDGHGHEYSESHFYFKKGGATREYVKSILMDWAAASKQGLTPTPAPSVVPPVAQVPPTANPKDRCNDDSFFSLMKGAQIGNYTGEAVAQYSKECPSTRTTRENIIYLVEKAASMGLPLSFAAVSRSDVGLAVVPDPAVLTAERGTSAALARTTGRSEPQGNARVELPGTDIITDGENLFIFAPVTATTLVTLTGSISTEVTLLHTCPGTGLVGGDISLKHDQAEPGRSGVFIARPNARSAEFDGLIRPADIFFPTPGIRTPGPAVGPTIDLVPRIEERNIGPRTDRPNFQCPP